MPYGPENAKGPGTRRPGQQPSGAGNPTAQYGDNPPAASSGNKKGPTTAQRQRARVGHLRTAIQSNKNDLAQQRRLAAKGTPDQRRAARLAQGPIRERIMAQAAQRDREYNKALKMGWSEDDLKAKGGNAKSDPKSQAPGVGNPSAGGGSNPPAVKGPKTTKSPRSVTPRKRDFTVDQKNVKSNTVLGKALKMYGDPRKGPDKTGEMLQDGAKSPHHVSLTGKEFQSFKKKYLATHADGKNLSDWSLRAMAKMLKYKNTASAKKTYGLSEYKPPEG